jgi:hypothetical protein
MREPGAILLPRYRVFYRERDLQCFWTFLKRYLGVLILVPGCFLKRFVPRFLFLTVCPRSWILVSDVRVLGVSIGMVLEVLGCLASCGLWLASCSWRVMAGYFRDDSWKGLCGRLRIYF